MASVEVRRRATTALAVAAWVATPLTLVPELVLDARLRAAGRPELSSMSLSESLLFGPVIVSAVTVGAIVAASRPRNLVGWLFLLLGFSVGASSVADDYAAYGLVARPGSLPAAAFVANASALVFMVWLVLIALVLQLTPTGRFLSRRWGRLSKVIVASGAGFILVGLFSSRGLDPPFQHVHNTVVLPGLAAVAHPVRLTLAVIVHLGVIASGVSLLLRFKRSAGLERRQLLWLVLVVVPLPAFVVGAFVAARTDHVLVLGIAAAGFVGLVPIAAGLAVMQYHLYDVDRIVSRATTYLLLSGLVAATYVAVVILVGRWLGSAGQRSQIAVVLATLAAVSVAMPARRMVQDSVDRRFNRRRFDTLRVVQRHLRDPAEGATIEDVLRRALGQPGLRVAYWVDGRDQWVTGEGQPAPTDERHIEVSRQGHPVARIILQDWSDVDLAEAAAREATPDLDNARLRAAVALQLVEVQESRTRIALAHVDERHRIGRNLHDGAQQRLLATALHLQAAQVNGEADQLRQAVAHGIDELRMAVADLRALANGLHPTILDDAGLIGALEELTARTPVDIELRTSEIRFPPDIEIAAWFIACEAIANAAKHADADAIVVTVARADDNALVLQVADDGRGGADAGGNGLRGILDRAQAAGGTLTVLSEPGSGTTVEARLPCG